LLGIDPSSGEVELNEIFRWAPKTDAFTYAGRSRIIEVLAEKAGVAVEDVRNELLRRKTVLDYMTQKKIRKYKDVGGLIRQYYADPVKTFERARLSLLSLGLSD
jgi:flagellar protein FlaI